MEALTCPAVLGVIVQFIQTFQILCIDDGRSGDSLPRWPDWTSWTWNPKSLVFSINGRVWETVLVDKRESAKPLGWDHKQQRPS